MRRRTKLTGEDFSDGRLMFLIANALRCDPSQDFPFAVVGYTPAGLAGCRVRVVSNVADDDAYVGQLLIHGASHVFPQQGDVTEHRRG